MADLSVERMERSSAEDSDTYIGGLVRLPRRMKLSKKTFCSRPAYMEMY